MFLHRARFHINGHDLRYRRTNAAKPPWIDVLRRRLIKHDSPAVRTPSQRSGVAAQFGQAPQRAPIGSNHIERRGLNQLPPAVPARALGVAIRSKRYPLSV